VGHGFAGRGQSSSFLKAAEKVVYKAVYFVIPNEARNLSSVCRHEKKERFLASLRMTELLSAHT
jgi:hypothetical protein